MKRKVQDFVRSLNHTSHYSGKTKTLFITGLNAESVELKVIKEFGYGLPFKTASQPVQMFNTKVPSPFTSMGHITHRPSVVCYDKGGRHA